MMATIRTEYTRQQIESDRRVLELLARSFPNVGSASSEIINLEAILNLPKGTEHFVADIHGESDAFIHILRNASGNIRRKVTEIFGTTLTTEDLRSLCALIYYPEQKLEYIHAAREAAHDTSGLYDFYTVTLHRLVKVARSVSSKYTRSKVRKSLPAEFAYIIEELLHESDSDGDNKVPYFNRIIETIISTDRADAFIIALAGVIQKLSIDRLHILGDVFDRGPGAHLIMDTLIDYGKFDFQWGNHDALWMGAAAGNLACIASVLRISLRYANLTTLQDGYGINLLPLATFAMETYGNDPCESFIPRVDSDDPAGQFSDKSLQLMARMHKAITILQFKLEAELYDRNHEWNMDSRKLLHHINYADGTIDLDGKVYELTDKSFPTIDPADPYRLTAEEARLAERLRHSFMVSDKLARHIDCLLSHGSMYGVYNSNLLFHASIPLNADGSLREVNVGGRLLKGRALLDSISATIRAAFNVDSTEDERRYARDFFWYLWSGPDSPLFDKARMATFERQFIADKETHREEQGCYYTLRNDPKVCDMIMDEFGAEGPHRHIINGHMPVRAAKGETPIRADGKLMVIDGGFARAYHATTGSAGYTLVFHSRGFQLVKHEPFTSAEDAITRGLDIAGTTEVVELSQQRMRVRDTDKGVELQSQIDELRELLYAFRHGYIKEHSSAKG